MSGTGTVHQIVFAEKAEQENMLISLDIEDDKLFLLHFIIGTYFGPDLLNHYHHPRKKQSVFKIQASSNLPTNDELSGSLMKRAELERVYRYILRHADPSLILNRKILRRYFNEKRNKSNEDFPLLRDLYPSELHPETRFRNQYKLIASIVFINDPDTSCMREVCVERFKRLTGLQSFTLSLNIDVKKHVEANEATSEIDEILEPSTEEGTCLEGPTNDNTGTCTSGQESDVVAKPGFGVNEATAEAQARQVMGLMDIGECSDAYLFRISLPGVKRDEREFSCEVEDNGKVLVRGITTTGEKQVHRYSQAFEMQTQNLCQPGHFSVSFRLPGPVHPQEFSGSFGFEKTLSSLSISNQQNPSLLFLSLSTHISEMAISKASVVALVAVIISVVATVASAQSEAPAPSPTSGSVAFSPSIISAGVAAVAALVFGSALRI